MSALQQRLAVNETVVGAELDGEMVLLDTTTGLYFGLDALGARIWRFLAAGADTDTIATALLADYDVEPARLRDDLAAFCDLLVAKGLARIATR